MLSQEEIDTQLDLLATNRSNLNHFLKQQALLGGEAYATPAIANGIREARRNIRQIKLALRENGVTVADRIDDGDAAYQASRSASPTTSPPPTTTTPAVDRAKLRQTLADSFSEDELRDLCFDLGVDYENLPGAGKSGKARELIAYAQRRGSLDKLVEQARQLRPNAEW